jgi:hypothetical protein
MTNPYGYEVERDPETGAVICCFGSRGWGPSARILADGNLELRDWAGDSAEIAADDIDSMLAAIASVREAR